MNNLDNCNCGCSPCEKCGTGLPILDIQQMPNSVSTLSYNINGVTTYYDYEPMIKATESDTSLNADTAKRVLKYMAERHTDTLTAKEVGAILHLADIGDVDITDVENSSFLVYKKDSDCAEGCEGVSNSWVGYNALDHINDSLDYFMGFDADGLPETLSRPTNTTQYYQLSWKAGDKAGWSQPVEVATAPTDTDGKKWAVYVDPTTKQLVYVKE